MMEPGCVLMMLCLQKQAPRLDLAPWLQFATLALMISETTLSIPGSRTTELWWLGVIMGDGADSHP